MTLKIAGNAIPQVGKGTAAPTAEAHTAGDIVFNTAGSFPIGWRCTASGTPGTWQSFGEGTLQSSITYDSPAVAAGAYTSTLVTVTGAVLGDYAYASLSVDAALLQVTAYVSAADTVTVVLYNPTPGTINLASCTLRARVAKS